MEKKSPKKASKSLSVVEFQKAYIHQILEHGSEPSSIYSFTKNLGVEESTFYAFFNSFKTLERSIWKNWLNETLDVIKKDEAYMGYSVREKLLAFYFTWLEALTKNRSYAIMRLETLKTGELNPPFLTTLKEEFESYIADLIVEGKDTGEVAERPLSSQYSKIFWIHFLFIQKFWSNDDSTNFDKTDAAVEKSVHLAFDLIGKGALDSMLDFGKFLFHNKKAFV